MPTTIQRIDISQSHSRDRQLTFRNFLYLKVDFISIHRMRADASIRTLCYQHQLDRKMNTDAAMLRTYE